MELKGVLSCVLFLLDILLVESTLILIDPNYSKMVELHSKNQPCRVHTDRNYINSFLSKTDPKNVQKMSQTDLNDLSRSCNDINQFNRTGGFIFPGTKWCGPGTVAKGYNDLGSNMREDRCCRDHDHCPNQLEPGQCRRGICNIFPFTMSHCDCDEIFKKCLREVRSDVANILGILYFNVAKLTCFRERRICPQSLRDNPSYSWFCEEWKFMPGENFTPSFVKHTNFTAGMNENEIPDGRGVKIQTRSKIDQHLETLFGKDVDIAKIMDDYKTSRN